MNIFVTSTLQTECAQDLPDILLRKMIVETAQLLSTAHHVLRSPTYITEQLYKKTHVNHPCAIWVRECYGNYVWTYDLFEAYCEEYRHRFGKSHKSVGMAQYLRHAPEAFNTQADKGTQRTSFVQCMPDKFKQKVQPHWAYCDYMFDKYINWIERTDKKQIIPTWTETDDITDYDEFNWLYVAIENEILTAITENNRSRLVTLLTIDSSALYIRDLPEFTEDQYIQILKGGRNKCRSRLRYIPMSKHTEKVVVQAMKLHPVNFEDANPITLMSLESKGIVCDGQLVPMSKAKQNKLLNNYKAAT